MSDQRVPIVERKSRVFLCPECGLHEFAIDHIVKNAIPTFGPWYCGHCGSGWLGLYRAHSLTLRKSPAEPPYSHPAELPDG